MLCVYVAGTSAAAPSNATDIPTDVETVAMATDIPTDVNTVTMPTMENSLPTAEAARQPTGEMAPGSQMKYETASFDPVTDAAMSVSTTAANQEDLMKARPTAGGELTSVPQAQAKGTYSDAETKSTKAATNGVSIVAATTQGSASMQSREVASTETPLTRVSGADEQASAAVWSGSTAATHMETAAPAVSVADMAAATTGVWQQMTDITMVVGTSQDRTETSLLKATQAGFRTETETASDGENVTAVTGDSTENSTTVDSVHLTQSSTTGASIYPTQSSTTGASIHSTQSSTTVASVYSTQSSTAGASIYSTQSSTTEANSLSTQPSTSGASIYSTLSSTTGDSSLSTQPSTTGGSIHLTQSSTTEASLSIQPGMTFPGSSSTPANSKWQYQCR